MMIIFLNFTPFVNVNLIRINDVSFNAIIGYVLILIGLVELEALGGYFQKAKIYTQFMLIYAVFLTIMGMGGTAGSLSPAVIFTINLSFSAVTLFIIHSFIKGISQLEAETEQELNSKNLNLAWWLLIAFTFLPTILLNNLSANPEFRLVWSIIITVSFAACLYYLIMLNKTRVLFNEQHLAPVV